MATSLELQKVCVWAGAEYPLLRFLERNGYDVSYQAGLDTHHRGLPQGTRLFISVGHDEYWSGPQRAAVEAARDAGTHLAFFSGNEVYCAFPLVIPATPALRRFPLVIVVY